MDRIAEIKERAELLNIRKRVEEQRKEIIRLNGIIQSQKNIIAEQGKRLKQTISRQAAIEAVEAGKIDYDDYRFENPSECNSFIDWVVETLKGLEADRDGN